MMMLTKMPTLMKLTNENAGEENSLAMRQTYTHRFQCRYLLHRYPFDTQVIVTFIIVTIISIMNIIITTLTQECEVLMVMGILDLATVSLIPHELAMRQNVLFHFLNRLFISIYVLAPRLR